MPLIRSQRSTCQYRQFNDIFDSEGTSEPLFWQRSHNYFVEQAVQNNSIRLLSSLAHQAHRGKNGYLQNEVEKRVSRLGYIPSVLLSRLGRLPSEAAPEFRYIGQHTRSEFRYIAFQPVFGHSRKNDQFLWNRCARTRVWQEILFSPS